MLQLIINKTTQKATVMFDGKEQTLNLVKVNKEGVKPGTYWVNLQPLGTPRKWQTVNFNEYADDVFTIETDETACRIVTPKTSRIVTLGNIKDFLTEEQVAQFEELYTAAQAEAKRRADEAEANKPVKEKKSRKMSLEDLYAKKMAEIEKIKKQMSGELPLDEPKARKKKAQAVVENLDDDTKVQPISEAAIDGLI